MIPKKQHVSQSFEYGLHKRHSLVLGLSAVTFQCRAMSPSIAMRDNEGKSRLMCRIQNGPVATERSTPSRNHLPNV